MKSTAFIESMVFPKNNVYGFLTGQLKQFTGTGADPEGSGGAKDPLRNHIRKAKIML